jgi:hypothetical protein
MKQQRYTTVVDNIFTLVNYDFKVDKKGVLLLQFYCELFETYRQ